MSCADRGYSFALSNEEGYFAISRIRGRTRRGRGEGAALAVMLLLHIYDTITFRYRRKRTERDERGKLISKRCMRSELVNCVNGPLLQHENSMKTRGVSPEQDAIRHQTMETAKIKPIMHLIRYNHTYTASISGSDNKRT
ncbi:hypothetical protein EVAR_39147_1 [Eumeta japonica]|uniref:Uncharacterized protein n=1 Tax=Eumeta variegata TaxID=151549 RepID=A0A4C1X850_EUMVA|nr:hypothetical protein EVAR_39147_1 [Eumeta japonica]